MLLPSGFRYDNTDKYIYSKFIQEYSVLICLNVDDMLTINNSMKGVKDTKKYLSSRFKMKNFRKVNTILDIKVKKHSGDYALCQSHYVNKLLNKFQHLKVKKLSTPFDHGLKLLENFRNSIF